MQTFKFFSCFVELNLSGLCLSHFLLKFISLASNLNGKFLNLKSKLLDLSLISTSELLQSQVIFFLLARGKSPLLQLLLIPVHLQFELVHALVCFEDHVLNIVQSVLLVSNPLLQLLDFVSQTTTLTFCDLFEVLLSFNLLILGVDKALCVHKLHLDRLEMLFKNLQTLLMLFNFQAELSNESHLLPHDLVQLLVLIVGIGWEVLVEVVLGDGVYNIVSHFHLTLCIKFLN